MLSGLFGGAAQGLRYAQFGLSAGQRTLTKFPARQKPYLRARLPKPRHTCDILAAPPRIPAEFAAIGLTAPAAYVMRVGGVPAKGGVREARRSRRV